MRLILTLVVKDAADILRTTLGYHLARGVDHVLVIDDGSTDETPAILESFVGEGRLTTVPRPSRRGGFGEDQPLLYTKLSRLAATEFEGDWVLPTDADEYWWPLHGDLKDALGILKPQYEGVLAPLNDFVFTGTSTGSALEDLTVREVVWTAGLRVAHRGFPDIVLDGGHHRAGRALAMEGLTKWESGDPLWFAPITPLRVFHYGIRNVQQYEHTRSRRDILSQMYPVDQRPGAEAAIGDAAWRLDAISRGLDERRLTVDTRLAKFHASELRGLATSGAPAPSRSVDLLSGKAPTVTSEEMLEAQGLVMLALQRRDSGLRERSRRLREGLDKWRGAAQSRRRLSGLWAGFSSRWR